MSFSCYMQFMLYRTEFHHKSCYFIFRLTGEYMLAVIPGTLVRIYLWHLFRFHDDVIKRNHFQRYWPFVCGKFLAQRPVTRKFDVFCDMHLNKRLGKQSRRWWFETPSRSRWRHCNGFAHGVYFSARGFDNNNALWNYNHFWIGCNSITRQLRVEVSGWEMADWFWYQTRKCTAH